MVANRIMDLATGIGFDHVHENLLPYFCCFLKDIESEVRNAALCNLADFCRILDKQDILQKIIPEIAALSTDTFVYVRCALAENLLTICPIIGQKDSNELIVPIFIKQLRDDSCEVRLKLFKRLDDLNSVIPVSQFEGELIDSLTNYKIINNWRLK